MELELGDMEKCIITIIMGKLCAISINITICLWIENTISNSLAVGHYCHHWSIRKVWYRTKTSFPFSLTDFDHFKGLSSHRSSFRLYNWGISISQCLHFMTMQRHSEGIIDHNEWLPAPDGTAVCLLVGSRTGMLTVWNDLFLLQV